MPSHPDRVRANYYECEISDKHNFFIVAHTDIAPFIMEDGRRKTIRECMTCGMRQTYMRSDDIFKKELENGIVVKHWSQIHDSQ